MGLRGPKAGTRKPTKRRGKSPWAGLSRPDAVIRFIEGLRITSGTLAGQLFTLRPWQREIIQSWYKTDSDGRRIVRTGLLSVGRNFPVRCAGTLPSDRTRTGKTRADCGRRNRPGPVRIDL